MKSWIKRTTLFASALFLVFLSQTAMAADTAGDIEQILKDIRQDQPVPKLDYLKKATPINADSAYYTGRYKDIEITVEAHPNSTKVASVLLKIPGPDQTREILPAVSRVIGKPHHSDPKQSVYSWEWRKYRSASLHYVGNGPLKERITVVSLFYR
ncbi:MAG: hypothetical protein H6R18_1599 [Proteobacteria bacterium]|nr:hypothetical protein [Pseudomonadota bacterium]